MAKIKAGDKVTLKQSVRSFGVGTKLDVIAVDYKNKLATVKLPDGTIEKLLLKLFVEYVAPSLFQLIAEGLQFLVKKIRAINDKY